MPWQTFPGTDIVAIHAALLPTSDEGDILCFGDWEGSGGHGVQPFTYCRLYHMTSYTVESFANNDIPNTNAFCSGQAFLADGSLLIAGGTLGWPQTHGGHHIEHWDGERACWLYLPHQKRWSRVRDLNFQPNSNSKGGGRWYPTLVTLANGEVFAAGGHPSDTDDYQLRHNNNTPERYSPTNDHWALMTADITAPKEENTDSYPRLHLLPNGLLFSVTAGNLGAKRLFDPYRGTWTGPNVDVNALPNYYSRGSAATSVLLPLLPPKYQPHVLVCNSPDNTAFRINVNNTPQWIATSNRLGSTVGQERAHACAVLLPTGEVLLVGGIIPKDGEISHGNSIKEPELYNPGINWNTGEFTNPDSWQTINEPATVGRGYHSVALLLPDGRVWTAGSTNDLEVLAEKRVEIFSPWYVGRPRPQILGAPTSILYDIPFTINITGVIQCVALIRCGSITHAFDADQRYVGLVFTQKNNQLTISAPPNDNIAPPGYYMLWIVNNAGCPCELARFIHVQHHKVHSYMLSGDRIAVLRQDNVLMVKAGGLDAAWERVHDAGIHSYMLSGDRIAVLRQDNVLMVKAGGLDAAWERVHDAGIHSYMLSGDRIAVLRQDNVLMVKAGGLDAAWERVHDAGIHSYMLSGDRIAVLRQDNVLMVKAGGLDAAWERVHDAGIHSYMLSGDRIAVLRQDNVLMVKAGGLDAAWERVHDAGIHSYMLSGDRIAVLRQDNVLMVKAGGLDAAWERVHDAGIHSYMLSGDRIAVLRQDNVLMVKAGGLDAAWERVHDAGIHSYMLSGDRIAVLRQDNVLVVKAGGLDALWIV